jgi:osmotically-inducible protein OsmY
MLNANQALFLMVVSAAAGAMCTHGVATSDSSRWHSGGSAMSARAVDPRADAVALLLDDTEITAMVESGLASEFGMSAHAFHVDTQGSVVTLSGNVDTVLKHDIALQVASDTVGVRGVVDAVTVRNAAAADLWPGRRTRATFEDTI